MLRVYTIGHGNESLEAFIERLNQHQIQELIDVRSVPKSGYVPHFNRPILEVHLPLSYRYAGEYLGGRPTDPALYKQGELPPEEMDGAKFLQLVDYKAITQQDWYQKGLRRVLQLSETSRVVLMCAEVHPRECHRHHLIARSLLDPLWRAPDLPDVEVWHILKRGELEPVDPQEFGPEQLSLL